MEDKQAKHIHKLKEHYDRNYFTGAAHIDVGRGIPNVATQQKLGLLSKRRTGSAAGDSDCPAFAGKNLKRAAHTIQTKGRLCYKALNNYPVKNSARRMATSAM
jgi:hypothetical protein